MNDKEEIDAIAGFVGGLGFFFFLFGGVDYWGVIVDKKIRYYCCKSYNSSILFSCPLKNI